jgi:hypothetical protein
LKNEKNIPLLSLPSPFKKARLKKPTTAMPLSKRPTHRLYCLYGDYQELTVDIYGIIDLRDWYTRLAQANIRNLKLSVLNP